MFKNKYKFYSDFKFPLVLILYIISIISCSKSDKEIEPRIEAKIILDSYGIVADSFLVEKGIIEKNETLADLLSRSNLDYSLISSIYEVAKPIFDFRKMQPNREFAVYKRRDSLNSFSSFVYEINKTKFIIISNDDSLLAEMKFREITKKEKSVSGIINSSLYETLMEQNSSIVLAGELAEVFAWQIDFYTIQRGDNFFAVYEELFVNGESVGIGDILVARFIHKNNIFNAFLFFQNEKKEYYDESGNSLQKEFLKAPVKYRRISSHYSGRRLHPILRVYRPHRGIDYAAAIGTPVQAVGDGIVIKVGRNGAAGKMVKIRHNSVYKSAYLHLSGYGAKIKTNAKVKQGQVVGYVGSSGLSTGPHLDFRFWKNGSLVNYLRQTFPSSKAIADSNANEFYILRDSLLNKVEKFNPTNS